MDGGTRVVSALWPLARSAEREWSVYPRPNERATSKLPMTEVMGSPPRGGSAHTPTAVTGGLHASSSPCGIAVFHGQVLPNGDLWGYGRSLSTAEALVHTALILGGLKRGCFAGGESHLGGTAASVPSCGSLPGRSVWGVPPNARTDGHVWPISTTTINALMLLKSFRNQPEQAESTDYHRVGFLLRLKSWGSASGERMTRFAPTEDPGDA